MSILSLQDISKSCLTRRGTLLGSLGLLAACGITSPAGTASYLDIPTRFQHTGQAPALWPTTTWWKSFGSSELDHYMELALTRNFDIRASIARLQQADAQRQIIGSSLFPTIDASGNATRQRSAALRGGQSSTSTLYNASLNAAYEVDFWGKNRANVAAAERQAQASLYDIGVVSLTTQASVATTYFSILAGQEEIRVQEANIASAKRALGIVRSQLQAGITTGLSVAQQETLLAQEQAQLPPLRQQVAQNTSALALLLGRPSSFFSISHTAFETTHLPALQPGTPAQVLTRRPDVWQAEALLSAANADVEAARAALFPSIQLTAQTSLQSLTLGGLFRPEAQAFSLVASLAQTLFDGGARRGQIALTQAQAEELVAQYQKTIVQALKDVEDALVATQETKNTVDLLKQAQERAQRAFQISNTQLQGGVIDALTLINTQQSLFSARRSLVQARQQHIEALISLFRALGGGWGSPLSIPSPPIVLQGRKA